MNKSEIEDITNQGDISVEIKNFNNFHAKIEDVKSQIGKQVFGQENTIDLCLCAILAGAHALLIGMPGVAKTSLVAAISQSLGQDFKRIQFTPDLMPNDILGSEILDTDKSGNRNFRFVKGPIFTQILMADEINRASPKTQSALLEAMQEGRITIAGNSLELPKPFHVLATQNPIEHEGAYPLPEAQLDRFLLQINVPYPDEATERKILIETTKSIENHISKPLVQNDLIEIQRIVRDLPISERLLETAIALVRNLRPETSNIEFVRQNVEWGPGPRAGQALILASKARAFLRGRSAPTLADLQFVAYSALCHRISFKWGVQNSGNDLNDLIKEIFDGFGA